MDYDGNFIWEVLKVLHNRKTVNHLSALL
jgi:hypothetical protein